MKLLLAVEMSDISELANFVGQVLNLIPRHSILLLSGPMGAGKTSFVVEFCKSFHINVVQSPTYAIHQRYSNSEMILDHFDLYRLENEDDIESAGFYDLLNDISSDYKIIEWPERVDMQSFPIHQPLFLIKISLVETKQTRLFQIFQYN